MLRSLAGSLALGALLSGCTTANPLFDVAPESGGGTGISRSTTDSSPDTVTAPTGSDSGAATVEPGSASTAAIDSSGPAGVTEGTASTTVDVTTLDVTTVDVTTMSDTTTGDTSTGGASTGDGSSTGDPGDGLFDVGEHSVIAAAHCVGIDKQSVAVTLSAAECAALIPKAESAAQAANFCPGLDPALFGSLGVDFVDPQTGTFVTTHLRVKFPEKLAPGTTAISGVLSLTAGCNAQWIAGNPDNVFKPGDLYLTTCDDVPEFDGDKHPDGQMKAFPVVLPAQEVGGAVKGALEPGERVEWKLDLTALNQMLIAGSDVCIGVWIPFNVANNVYYQGSKAPSPPRLSFTIQAK